MREVIDTVANKNFGEFSKIVKQKLENNLKDNPYIKQKAQELKNYNDLESKFKAISDTSTDTTSTDTTSTDTTSTDTTSTDTSGSSE